MALPRQYDEFLTNVASFNRRFNAFRVRQKPVEPLHHSFWTRKQIDAGWRLNRDWSLPAAKCKRDGCAKCKRDGNANGTGAIMNPPCAQRRDGSIAVGKCKRDGCDYESTMRSTP
jgi:hypothetical protein